MKGLQHNNPCSAIFSHRPRFMILVVLSASILFAFVLSACSGNQPSSGSPVSNAQVSTTSTSGNQPSSGSPVSNAQVSTTSSAAGYHVKVFFSKSPDSLNNINVVFPVNRVSPTTAVATFTIQLLLAGPTLSERNAGYFSEFNSILTGPSSCSAPGGPDFKITLNMKGSTPAPGTATLRLCRATSSPGIGADYRILDEINATLKQFSNIKTVVVLTQTGHCFPALGPDLCLR
jgi:hypothetical protein